MSELNNSEPHQKSLTIKERVGKFFGKSAVDYLPDYEALPDNLTIDISALNPTQESALQSNAQTTNQHILEVLGKFIPKPTVERNKGIEKRIIVASKEDFEEYVSSVFRFTISDVPDLAIKGLAQQDSILMLQSSDMEAWKYLDDESRKELYRIGDYKEREKAKEKVNEKGFNRTLYHELIHIYQSQYPPDKSKPLSFYFREAGAYFYAGKLYPDSPSSVDGEVLSNLYSQLAEKYGDDLHRLFFGQPILDSVRKQIMHDFKNSKLVYDEEKKKKNLPLGFRLQSEFLVLLQTESCLKRKIF